MKKLILLSMANIRKTKGHSVSLFIMFFIASLLLNAGLLILINFGSFFHNILSELNTSDSYYVMPSSIYTDEVENFFETHSNIREIQVEDDVWAKTKTQYNGSEREVSMLFCNADNKRNLSSWKFIGKHREGEKMSIYLPYIFQLDGGYELGDTIQFVVDGDITLDFTVNGFTEDVYFSSFETGALTGYLPQETFDAVKVQLGENYNATLVYANQIENNSDVEMDIRKIVKSDQSTVSSEITSGLFSLDLSLVELARVMMSNVVSVMVVAFAAIITIVSLIVVRFRIGISIVDDMTKIGSLKAIGYTSKQIIASIAMQFVMIALVGSVVGIGISYTLLPVLSDAFAVQSGLKWIQGFDGVISFVTLSVILLITLIVAYHSSRKINKLNPIVALRGGIITHSFLKNPMPLHRSRGRLSFVLAIKSLLQSKKQSIMIAVILIAVSFAGSYAVVLFYNTTIDTKAFKETPGVELSNVIAIRSAEAPALELMEEMSTIKGVRKAQYIDEATVIIEKNEIVLYVMEDYAKRETQTVYEGRYPLHENEIAISGFLAEQIHKSVGEKVTVEYGNEKIDYLITGLSQGSNMGGRSAFIRVDGFEKLSKSFEPMKLQIYLEKDVKSADIVSLLETSYKDKILSVVDMDKYMQLGMGVYTNIVSKIGIVILVVTLAVVLLVLYFVLNSSVVRKKRELGIQKAIGFTTFQLMNQLSLGFLPPVIVGVMIGNLLGITQTNEIMSMAQRAMGIMRAGYIVKPVWVLLFGCAVVVVSYITSMLITYRIRKISAYALVSE